MDEQDKGIYKGILDCVLEVGNARLSKIASYLRGNIDAIKPYADNLVEIGVLKKESCNKKGAKSSACTLCHQEIPAETEPDYCLDNRLKIND